MELRKVANHPLLRRELFTMTTLAQMAVELKNVRRSRAFLWINI